jgi:hypothetical protein
LVLKIKEKNKIQEKFKNFYNFLIILIVGQKRPLDQDPESESEILIRIRMKPWIRIRIKAYADLKHCTLFIILNTGFYVTFLCLGSTYDARVWRTSEAKVYLEGTGHDFLLAGDSGYPISQTLVKPYPVDEAGRDASKRLFNQRLSGLRTAMTECIFGVLKRRMPCLNQLRCHLPLAQVFYSLLSIV